MDPRPRKMPSQFKIVSFNAEGLSSPKSDMLSKLNADVLRIQETYKKDTPPRIPGMHLLTFHPSAVHGSTIYIRDKSMLRGYRDLTSNGIEILVAKTNLLTIISVYKPPPAPFSWPYNLQLDENANIIIGDFNSHNILWGYDNNNRDGVCNECSTRNFIKRDFLKHKTIKVRDNKLNRRFGVDITPLSR